MAEQASWVFIQGLMRESGHWGRFLDLFQERYPMADPHCLDLPGCGDRVGEMSPYRISEVALSLRSEAFNRWDSREGCKTKPKRFLVSISLGAMVAVNWLKRFPSDFDGAILINTSMPMANPVVQRFRPASLPIAANILRAKTVEEREAAVLDLISNHPKMKHEIHSRWVEIQKARPVARINLVRQLLMAVSFRTPPLAPHENILLLASEKDRLASVKCSTTIQKKWDVPLKVHPWAGHDVILDDPEWVMERVNQWVESF